MNKKRETIEKALNALAAHGLKTRVKKLLPLGGAPTRPDALVQISHEDRAMDFMAVVKHTVTTNTLGAVLAQVSNATHGTKTRNLLIAEYITAPVAEALRDHGQAFIDTVGNAFIDGPGALIFVTHRREPTRRPRANQAFTIGGLKLLFAMICEPRLANEPQRKIAFAAGVALGTVPKVFADMKKEGWLLTAGKNRRLNATKNLLDNWAQAYAQRLRPKTLIATYRTPQFNDWKTWKIPQGKTWWGGEPAANLLVGYLNPGVLTLYAEKLPRRIKAEQQLRRADVTERAQLLDVRAPFWVTEQPFQVPAETVPPALVYADLLATGEARCIETAGLVYDKYLARFFPAG